MKIRGFKCNKAIIINGYMRCGQHAICCWMFSQFSKQNLFLNSWSPHKHNKRWFKDGGLYKNGNTGKINILGFGLEGRERRLDDLPRVVVVRDVKNHYSSLLKHPKISTKKFFELWRGYIETALSDTNQNDVVVNFPRWVVSLKYRCVVWGKILQLLKTDDDFTDRGREYVMGAGGGSSFDKRKYNTCASKMNVNERWVAFKVKMNEIPKDLLKMNKEYFGNIYD